MAIRAQFLWRVSAACCCLAMLFTLGTSIARADNGSDAFFESSFGDLTEELEIAREDGKKGVLVFFELTECPFCHRLRETVLSRAEVQSWYKQNFRCVTMDIEGDTEVTDFDGSLTTAKAFAANANVKATPVIAFYDLQGQQVVRYTGAPRTADEFMLLGEFAANEHYETSSFTRFKRTRRKETAAQE